MFALRRAAVRALSQPSRQVCTARNTSRTSIIAQHRPAFQRSLHQSIRWYSEADSRDDIVSEQGKGDALSGFSGNAHIPTSSKIVFVGNLFFSATASDIEAEFSRYGTVVNTRVVTDGNGQSKGFGFIEFEKESEARAAVEQGDTRTFQGRRLSVQVHKPRERTFSHSSRSDHPPAPPSKTLFVGNMSFQMSDRDLNDLFRDIKNVVDVRVAVDRKTGQPRGFAHADFMDVESATAAREQLQGKVIYGRSLRADFTRNASPYGTAAPRVSEENSA